MEVSNENRYECSCTNAFTGTNCDQTPTSEYHYIQCTAALIHPNIQSSDFFPTRVLPGCLGLFMRGFRLSGITGRVSHQSFYYTQQWWRRTGGGGGGGVVRDPRVRGKGG